MDEAYAPAYDPNNGGRRHELEEHKPPPLRSRWLVYAWIVAVILLVSLCYLYVSGERQRNRDLAAANENLAASLTQFQSQLRSMSERLNDLQARMAPPSVPPRAQRPARVRPTSGVSVVRNDPRLIKIQSQLSEQQNQIAGAREDIDKTKNDLSQTRDDLQSNINSTKNELNGSIGRTHDEVVALQKRGERNYYEFAIDKSKQYSRVGPMSVMLRKADTKHKRFDMTMQVQDNELHKNGVNLYETVWISLSDRPQPVEFVVNKIAKNHIEGYLSEPKYKRSELQSAVSMNPAPNGPKPLGTQHTQ